MASISKSYTLVRASTDPLRTVANLNPENQGPVHYVLRFACAFPSCADALFVRDFLATKKRSFHSKKKCLLYLADRHQLHYYSSDIRPPGGTREYLKKHAPRSYVNAYDRLINKKTVHA